MNAIGTGATGLLSRQLVNKLVAHHRCVTAIMWPLSIRPRVDIDYRVCELDAMAASAEWFAHGDVVCHAASTVNDWVPWKYHTRHPLEAARQICEPMRSGRYRRLVHVTTVGVYGRLRTAMPIRQNHVFGFFGWWDYYANSKIAAARLVCEYHANGTVAAPIVRRGMTYGFIPTGWVSRLGAMAQAGKRVLVSDPQTRLPLAPVTDAGRSFVTAVTYSLAVGEALHIFNEEPLPQGKFVQTIASFGGASSVIKRAPYRLADSLGSAAEWWARLCRVTQPPRLTRYRVCIFGHLGVYTTKKIRELLAWQSQVSFASGIRHPVATT